MRTTGQILAEIQENFGFVPPFFEPAIANPQVLENLWQQTRSAYILNPFSPLFKEKLFAYLSRYCSVPYCLVCHSCALHELGLNGREVLHLLETPPPPLVEINFHLRELETHKSELSVLSQLNTALEESLWHCAIFIFTKQKNTGNCRQQLRSLVGYENYQHLVTFVAYTKTCHEWMEAHPEVSYESDKRALDNLAALLEEEPAIADFFQSYVECVNRERATNFITCNEKIGFDEYLQLSQALNSASVGIVITNPRQPDNPIVYSNPAFSQITGYQLDEIIGRNCRFLQGANTDPQVVEHIRRGIAQSKEVKATLLNYCKNGQPFWNELKISPVFSDVGELIYFIGFQIDITEKKQLEAQVFRAQRMESIGNLATGIAHNLNNALAPVMMAVHLLENNLRDEQSQNLLEIVEANTKRSADIVKQVLSFVRGITGEHTTLRVETVIEEIAQVVIKTFPKSIEFRKSIPSSQLWSIIGDATQLHQVLLNLCTNACDAMPTGGILSIAAKNVLIDSERTWINSDAQEGYYVVITVADTGTGIKPEILSKIFDPFFTTKEFGKGKGLGLATVQGILKGHGGFVNIYSEVGKGSQVQVYLPAIEIK